MNAETPVLRVENLSIDLVRGAKPVRLVDNVSFEVAPHEVLGVVGESGSGKSITMLAVLGLLPPALRVSAGGIWLKGQDITRLPFRAMRKIRGKTIALIFQDPMTALNPVLRVGPQIAETIRLHNPSLARAKIRDRVVELLDLVGIPDPGRRYGQYPNEFSGGMRQRAVIAMAVANEPDLLIADEPTTALDVTIQAQVISVLAAMRARTGAAMVLITHDLGLVAEAADRIAVMYAGQIVETSSARRIFGETRHPYAAGLIASLPRMDLDLAQLYSIPGVVPDFATRPSGCAFHPRCGLAHGRQACVLTQPLLKLDSPGHFSACHFSDETGAWAAEQREPREGHTLRENATEHTEVILQIDRISKVFPVAKSSGWGRDQLHALTSVSFEIRKGRTLGLVGESGCGKSTLSKVILQLEQPSAGAVRLKSENLVGMSAAKLRLLREQLQIVFQDPYSSLDPRFAIRDVVAEPLRIHGRYDPKRVTELLGHVGLGVDAESRKPAEFSGGQRQRIAIARAFLKDAPILLLDEATAALDTESEQKVQAALERLMAGRATLMIAHRLSTVRNADRIYVIDAGRIVEEGTHRSLTARRGLYARLAQAQNLDVHPGEAPTPLAASG